MIERSFFFDVILYSGESFKVYDFPFLIILGLLCFIFIFIR